MVYKNEGHDQVTMKFQGYSVKELGFFIAEAWQIIIGIDA